MSADGSAQTRLTNNGAFDGEARWSPDDSQILFTSNRDDVVRLYLVNPDRTGKTVIPIPDNDNRTRPAWQPLP